MAQWIISVIIKIPTWLQNSTFFILLLIIKGVDSHVVGLILSLEGHKFLLYSSATVCAEAGPQTTLV